jgi:hypothetical protein
MLWARLLAYVTGTVNQELLLRNEYLACLWRIVIPPMIPQGFPSGYHSSMRNLVVVLGSGAT